MSAMLQTSAGASRVENIRSLCKVGGYVVAPLSWEVNNNGHGSIDTATIMLPIKGNRDWPAHLRGGKALDVDIRIGFPSNPNQSSAALFPQLSSRFTGTVDPIQPQFDTDICTLQCRSYGAILAATKTTTNLGARGYRNLNAVTTTDVIKYFASKHGFQTNIQMNAAPATLQDVWKTQQMVGVKNLYEWDVLMYCAETDGVFVWVSGKTINYCDPLAVHRDELKFRWMIDIDSPMTFGGQHSPQFAKDVQVVVRSYTRRDSRSSRVSMRVTTDANGNISAVQRESTSRTYTQQNYGNPGSATQTTRYSTNGTTTSTETTSGSTAATGGAASSTSGFENDTGTKYVFTVGGLTQQQCENLALQKWKYISLHEYSCTFSVPVRSAWFQKLNILTKMFVSGLPWSSFDQGYLCKRQTEQFSSGSGGTAGYMLTVDGVNHQLPLGAIS